MSQRKTSGQLDHPKRELKVSLKRVREKLQVNLTTQKENENFLWKEPERDFRSTWPLKNKVRSCDHGRLSSNRETQRKTLLLPSILRGGFWTRRELRIIWGFSTEWRTCGAWWIREPGYACSHSLTCYRFFPRPLLMQAYQAADLPGTKVSARSVEFET